MKKNGSVFWVPPLLAADGEMTAAGIDAFGREVPDPVPQKVVVEDIPPQNDIIQTIRQVLNSDYLRRKADEEGFDTPEEADDFEDEDDEFQFSQYQKYLMEKDLNPTPHPPADGQKTGQGKSGEVVAPPPVEASKPDAELGPGSVVSSEVGKPGIEQKVRPEG